ncbi:hypothetical protein F4802DRAFT_577280 [Xylaria palmicola]|nr:hypothetical protein F4802DRAFT_577280 [Xylaria palmicola]
MTREKKKVPAPAHGIAAAARRAKMERAMQYSDHVWRSLNPLKAAPKMKHKSYFEAVENADKKRKKLEFEITTNREPPPGFEFIPTGHPELSQECKEQSRDSDAMYFIVSNSKDTLKLDHHMNRLGYHFRCSIVEEARKVLSRKGHHEQAAYVHDPGRPEPIPNSQREIDNEADAVLRDLFPRIPHTDRREIIDHAFKKDGMFNGGIKVGMAKDITLARRVQLAALAHIRHTHTRYDELLKESDWANARKAVEKPCLDIIVKWRGDEETGRDQLDEILREVIEISDTENESEDENDGTDHSRFHTPRTGSAAALARDGTISRLSRPLARHIGADSRTSSPGYTAILTPSRLREPSKVEKRTARKTQKRFKRYAAAAEALANSVGETGQERTPGLYTSRGIPVTHRHSINTDRMEELPPAPLDGHGHDARGSTEQFIRIPDAQRPKVGPYSANSSHTLPPPPLSPVRLGLQDMLLPSIEPRSPDGTRITQDASQRVHHEIQSAEVPRVVSRINIEPVVSDSRPRSPGVMIYDDGVVPSKRPRITTYFPEDFERTSNSHVRVAPRSHDDALHRPHPEYLVDRDPLAMRAPERVMYENMSWTNPIKEVRVVRPEDDPNMLRARPIPVTGDDRSCIVSRTPGRVVYQSNVPVPPRREYRINRVEAPLRSRANPVVIDGDYHYESRRVVELRGPPTHEFYRKSSPRESDTRDSHGQGELHNRDFSKVIYVDDSASHSRDETKNRHNTARFHSGNPVYDESHRLLSDMSPQHQPQHHPHTLERSPRYPTSYDRDILQIHEQKRTSMLRPDSPPKEIQVPLPNAPGYERSTWSRPNDYRSCSDFDVVQQPMQQQRHDNVTYRELKPDANRPLGVEYYRGPQQPFPVYPAPSSYVEIRGPPTHRRIPDHRDMIYVE